MRFIAGNAGFVAVLGAFLVAGCAAGPAKQSFESNVETCRPLSIANCLTVLDQQKLSGRPRSEILMSLTLSRLVASDGEGAIPYLDAIIAQDPDYALAYQNRGTAYVMMATDRKEAGADSHSISALMSLGVADLSQAIKLNPDISAVYLIAMTTEAAMGQCDNVKSLDDRFAAQFGTADDQTRQKIAIKCQSELAAKSFDDSQSAQSSKRITSYDPGKVDMPANWGPLEPCHYEPAVDCARRADELTDWTGNYSIVLVYLAIRELQLINPAATLSYLDVVAHRDPTFAMSYQHRGNAYLMTAEQLQSEGYSKDSPEVTVALTHAAENKAQAAKLEPDNPSHYIGAAAAYAKLGQCDKAQSYLRQYRSKFAIPQLDEFIPAIEADCKI